MWWIVGTGAVVAGLVGWLVVRRRRRRTPRLEDVSPKWVVEHRYDRFGDRG
jgi:hypothetical protein